MKIKLKGYPLAFLLSLLFYIVFTVVVSYFFYIFSHMGALWLILKIMLVAVAAAYALLSILFTTWFLFFNRDKL